MLGIGTTTPGAKLDVNGTIRATAQIIPTSGSGIEIYRDGSARNRIIGYTHEGTPAYEKLYLDGTEIILQGLNTGNVGIGTSSPGDKLHVAGNILVNTTKAVAPPSVSVISGGSIGAGDNTTTTPYSSISFSRGGTNYFEGYVSFNVKQGGYYDSPLNEVMRINQSGNVGIGTTVPQTKLDVYGQVRISGDNFVTSQGDRSIFVINNILNNVAFSYWDRGAATGGYFDIQSKRDGTQAYTVLEQNDAQNIVLRSTGNVGIGTTTPQSKLDFGTYGANQKIVIGTYMDGNFWTGIGMDAATAGIRLAGDPSGPLFDVGYYSNDATHTWTSKVYISGGGVVRISNLSGTGTRSGYSTADGTLTNTGSDKRLKTNIQDLTSKLDIIPTLKKLRGVYYNWNTNIESAKDLGNQQEIGMIAQEVELVMPELVGTNANGYKSLDYPKLSAFLVEVDKAQQSKIDGLEKIIIEQQKQIEVLNKRIDELTSKK